MANVVDQMGDEWQMSNTVGIVLNTNIRRWNFLGYPFHTVLLCMLLPLNALKELFTGKL